MKRLTVLLSAPDPTVRSVIERVLRTRNYRLIPAHTDQDLLSSLEDHPHQLAVVAPENAASVATYATYRERATAQGVKVVACLEPSLKDVAPPFGDITLPIVRGGDGLIDREGLLEAIDKVTRGLVTILVVDDEPMIRRMFSTYLKREGFRLLTAENGRDAIEKVKAHAPDLVVTDIHMPEVDGYEVCRSIKESRETQHIPVVIVSALGGEVDIDKGFHAGANEYVTKPVDLTELSGRIQNIFRGIALRGRERVMVITSSPIELSLLDYGLTQQGFEVLAAHTGEEALDVAKRDQPAVIISDLTIPGLELASMRNALREQIGGQELPLVVLSSAATKLDKTTRDALRASAYLMKPFPMERLVVAIERILGERRSNIELERELLLQAIRSLVTTLEGRDSYTRGHSDNVARYTGMMSKHVFEGDDEKIARMVLSAQLHDIGKIAVPDAVLLKPGKLEDNEWAVMKTHPSRGAEMLEPIQSLRDILPGVRWHHERLDGKGYPDQLAGTNIPQMARIIAVADTFDALTMDRPYRNGFPLAKAVGILNEIRGTQLDPVLVDLFCGMLAKDPDPLRKGIRGTTPAPATPAPAT